MEATQHVKHNYVNEDYRVVLIPKDMVDFIKELTLIKRPDSYTEALSGLGAEMWKKVGGTDYIRRDREQWDD